MVNTNVNDSRYMRLSFVDIAKGIGIILVICSHVDSRLMSWAVPCFVPIFFVVSGYCTTHPVNISSKFKKLMLPYLVFTVTLMVAYIDFKPITILGSVYSRWSLYPVGIEPNIYFLRLGNGPLWFLTSMFVAFTLYKVIQLSNKPWILVFIYLIATFLLSRFPILLPWSIDTAFLMAVFIFAGFVIRKKNLIYKLTNPILIILILIYAVFTMYCGDINLSVRLYGTSLLLLLPAAIIGSVLLMKLSTIIDGTPVGLIFQKVGLHSLPIFCIHVPLMGLCQRIVSTIPVNMHPLINSAFVVILLLIVTYPLAIIFDLLIKKLTILLETTVKKEINKR